MEDKMEEYEYDEDDYEEVEDEWEEPDYLA